MRSKKPTVTIQIFYLELMPSRSAVPPSQDQPNQALKMLCPKLRERRVAIGKIKHSDHKKIYNFIKNQDFCLKKGNLGEENNKEKK